MELYVTEKLDRFLNVIVRIEIHNSESSLDSVRLTIYYFYSVALEKFS